MEDIELWMGDCLVEMKRIGDGSIDLILCDLPYGTTRNKWDIVIPLDSLWKEYKRIIKKNGAIVLTSTQPFTSVLVMSNPKMFKYDWIWVKNRTTNYLNAKKQPLRATENILVFYQKQCYFNPIPFEEKVYKHRSNNSVSGTKNYRDHTVSTSVEYRSVTSAKNIIYVNTVHPDSQEYLGHSTQKPVELMEYFIKTYSRDGETVLDNTMGVGSTGVAAKNLGRKFIGIEKDEKYFKIAQERII